MTDIVESPLRADVGKSPVEATPAVEAAPPPERNGKAEREKKAEPEAPAEPESKAVGVAFRAEHITAEHMYVGGTVIVPGQTTRTTRNIFQRLPWGSVAERRILLSEDLLERTSVMLQRRRVLFIAGEPELGKATLALAVVRRAVGDASPPSEVLISRDVERTTSVSLEDWAKDQNYRNRVLLFKDGLIHGNESLRDLGQRLDPEYLDELTGMLREARMFVIVTSDFEHVPNHWKGLADADVYCDFLRPKREDLLKFLEEQVLDFSRKAPSREGAFLAELRNELERIVQRIGSIPRLLRFRRDHFELIAESKATVEGALTTFADLTHWFMVELRDRDPAAYCFAFAVSLLQADPAMRSVPWALAIQLASALARHLHPSMEGWNRRHPPVFVEPDRVLLQRAHMELADDGDDSALGDRVRFSDESYPGRLWRGLLESGRGLLWTTLPLLSVIAKDEHSPLRPFAYTALGRAGASEGANALCRQMLDLMRSDDRNAHVLLGRFLVGVRASENAACFDYCVGFARASAEAPPGRPWPFMLAMREIGLHDLERAVAEIAGVVQRGLSPRWGKLRPALLEPKRGARAMEGLFDETTTDLLSAVEFSIVGLCFGCDPVDVCLAFARYLQVGDDAWQRTLDPSLGCAISLAIFDPGGALSILARHKETLVESSGASLDASRIVLSLAKGSSERIELFADFASQAFECLALLPAQLAQGAQNYIVTCLEEWSKDGVKSMATRPAMVRLLIRLMGPAGSPGLSAAVSRLLRDNPDFRKRSSPLQSLAVDVLTSGYAPVREGQQ